MINKETTLKIISIFLIIILGINLILIALSRISQLFFWIVLAIIGFIAYLGIPLIKKHRKTIK